MTNTQKKAFVKLWSKEYELTVKIHNLQERSDFNYRVDKPTARIEASINTCEAKRDVLITQIIEGVKHGDFTYDAVYQCADLLGDLGGYVVDCYNELYNDYAS